MGTLAKILVVFVLLVVVFYFGVMSGNGTFSIPTSIQSTLPTNIEIPSSSPVNIPNPVSQTTNTQPKISISSLELQIHSLINQERNKNGLTSLSYDSRLADIARAHSQDMANKNYFSHDSPEGADLSARFAAAGYSPQKIPGIYSGENIFLGNLVSSIRYVNSIPSYNWNTQDDLAQTTVQGWMNSPGHRKNILTSSFHAEGIGIAISNDNQVYVTEDFVAGSPGTTSQLPSSNIVTNPPASPIVQSNIPQSQISQGCSFVGKYTQTEYQGKPVSNVFIQLYPDNRIELYQNNKLLYAGNWALIGPNKIQENWTYGIVSGGDIATLSPDCKTITDISSAGEHSTFVRS